MAKDGENQLENLWSSIKYGHLLENAFNLFRFKYNMLMFKVLRPSGPNYWKNVDWIPHVFCKEYCSECRTN